MVSTGRPAKVSTPAPVELSTAFRLKTGVSARIPLTGVVSWVTETNIGLAKLPGAKLMLAVPSGGGGAPPAVGGTIDWPGAGASGEAEATWLTAPPAPRNTYQAGLAKMAREAAYPAERGW